MDILVLTCLFFKKTYIIKCQGFLVKNFLNNFHSKNKMLIISYKLTLRAIIPIIFINITL